MAEQNKTSAAIRINLGNNLPPLVNGIAVFSQIFQGYIGQPLSVFLTDKPITAVLLMSTDSGIYFKNIFSGLAVKTSRTL